MSAVTKLMTPGGGGVSLTPASSIASDVTVNVPSQDCTLSIQGPAFSAYMSANQSISNATATLLNFDTESFDTNSCFNTTTHVFTPNVAGYYQFNINIGVNTGALIGQSTVLFYKNGSLAGFGTGQYTYSSQSSTALSCSIIVYCNGTTDYVGAYVNTTTGGLTVNGSAFGLTSFTGAMVRGA